MKVAGLHTLSHDDTDRNSIHCVLCDITLTNNHNPILAPNAVEYKLENNRLLNKKNTTLQEYQFIFYSTDIRNHLFSMPPPISESFYFFSNIYRLELRSIGLKIYWSI